MKKIIAILALFGATSVFAVDSYLYWLVDVNENGYDGKAWTASVQWKNGSESDTLLNYYGNGADAGDDIAKATIASYKDYGVGLYADITGVSAGSFWIEIVSDWGTFKSGELSYSAAVEAANIAQNGIGTPASSMWAPSVTMSVPEPSSGLLMLIGCAVLGLRRKKQQKKA